MGRTPKRHLKRYGNHNVYVDLPPVGPVGLTDDEMHRLNAYAALEGISRAGYVTRMIRRCLIQEDQYYAKSEVVIQQNKPK